MLRFLDARLYRLTIQTIVVQAGDTSFRPKQKFNLQGSERGSGLGWIAGFHTNDCGSVSNAACHGTTAVSSVSPSPVGLARCRRTFHAGVILLILAFSQSTPSSAGASRCAEQPRFGALIREEGHSRLGYVGRKAASGRGVQLDRSEPDTYHFLSVLLLQHGNLEKGIQWTRRGPSVVPGDPQLRLDHGVSLLSEGHQQESLAILKGPSKSAQGQFYLDMAKKEDRDPATPSLTIGKRLARHGCSHPAHDKLIEQDRALHDQAGGLKDIQILQQRFPRSPWLYMLLGDACLSRSDDSGAKAEDQQALDLNPQLPNVHFNLGLVCFDRADYSPAVEASRKEIPLRSPVEALRAGNKRFPIEASFTAQSAVLLTQIGRRHRAEQETLLAQSRRRKANPQSITKAAVDSTSGENEPPALKAGDIENSLIDDLRFCLEQRNAACATALLASIRDPDLQRSAAYQQLKTRAQTLEQEEKQALSASESAVRANPTHPEDLINRGQIYEKFGDQVPAIQTYLEAAKLEPGSPEPLYFIGTSFFLLAEHSNSPEYFSRAEQNLKTALKLSPDYDRAEFLLSAIAAMQGRLSEAQTYLRQAIRVKPANAYYHLHYGILLKRLGDDDAAMKEMETAERLNPSYALTHYELGSLYERLGKYKVARIQFESAVRLDPNLSAAYYHLRSVYHHLGLLRQSRRAYDQFKLIQARGRHEVNDSALTASSIVYSGALQQQK
jgi:tetratricopeptide (TPR) repeat protein